MIKRWTGGSGIGLKIAEIMGIITIGDQMPVDMKKYPANWEEIRRAVLLRAGGSAEDARIGARCEFCGVLNYAVGFRGDDGIFNPIKWDCDYSSNYQHAREIADFMNDQESPSGAFIVIVLTVAHLKDPNPANIDMSNLAALCQRCHNKFDIAMRVKNAKRTRFENIIHDGQLELLKRG